MAIVNDRMSARDQRDDRERLRQPDEPYAWRHIITIYASIVVFCAAAFLAWTYIHPAVVLLIAPFLGAEIYKITIIMHDCCHSSLFGSKVTNRRVGVFSGFFVGTQFDAFCRAHWKHHATFGDDSDPQGDDYLHLDEAPKAVLVWHLLRPLIGYNLWKLMVFKPAGEEKPIARRDKLVFVIGTLSTQFVIMIVATGGLRVLWLTLFYPACAATFALFFSQIRGFVEHVALPGVSPSKHARTHLPNFVDRIFFYTLNFNYHIEHHRYPLIPSCHLPEIHNRMIAEDGYGEASPSVASTISKRLSAAGN